LPGTLSWQVRLDLAQGALGDQLGLALVAVALLPLVPVARLMWTGIRPLGTIVAAGGSERFAPPPRMEDAVGASLTEGQSSDVTATTGEIASPAISESADVAQASVIAPVPAEAAQASTIAPELTDAPGIPAIAPEPMPGPAPRVTLEPAAAGATAGVTTAGGPVTDTIWASESGTDTLWASGPRSNDDDAITGRGFARQPSSDAESEAPSPAPGSPAAPEPSTPEAPSRPADVPSAATLSSSGRAVRAARKASQPTIAGPASPDEPEALTVEAAPTGRVSTPSPRPPGWEPALTWLRSARAAAAAAAGPLRHALRDLPALWALDRTLIASLATLVLALVGLAFAIDVVGLGSAAGLATASTPVPGSSPAP
jgi:hypothetical protein